MSTNDIVRLVWSLILAGLAFVAASFLGSKAMSQVRQAI